MQIDNQLTVSVLMQNEWYFIVMQMKPNVKDETLITRFVVHFEVMNVVNCNKINFYGDIENLCGKFSLLI